MELLFEKSRPGRRAFAPPPCDVPEIPLEELFPDELLREDTDLPELSEIDVVRHYTHLSRRNFGVDLGFYPLGSCTMKYNPKIDEDAAALQGFTALHPLAPAAFSQGNLRLLFELERCLSEIFGMEAFSLQPAAGPTRAHGGHDDPEVLREEGEKRTRILIPDSAHGTNPASSALCGFQVASVPSDREGNVDLDKLSALLGSDVAGLMLTNPNTLGLFERNIEGSPGACTRRGPALRRRGKRQRVPGKGPSGGPGIRRDPAQPSQDLSTPHGSGDREAVPWCRESPRSIPPRSPGNGGKRLLPVGRGLPRSIGRSKPFMETSTSWSRPTPISGASARRASADRAKSPFSTPTTSGAPETVFRSSL